MIDQDFYCRSTCYRGPTHPVVKSYVEPKLALIKQVAPLSGKSVVDIGCGPCLFTYHLASLARTVVGCDRSALIWRRVCDSEMIQANASALPFEDNSFDVAFEANVLRHVQDPSAVLREMKRVARKTVVFIEANAVNPVMFVYSLVNPAERGLLRSTRRQLCRLLKEAGLEPAKFWTTGMISQNKTPGFLIPILRIFDFDFALGEYHVCVAAKAS